MRVVGIIATIVVVLFVIGVLLTAVLSAPDFRRYLHMRKM